VSTARTLDKILKAFADAVAAGDYERAEGWLAVARFSEARSSASTAPLERARIGLMSARDGHTA
jgi:hypothetical protein